MLPRRAFRTNEYGTACWGEGCTTIPLEKNKVEICCRSLGPATVWQLQCLQGFTLAVQVVGRLHGEDSMSVLRRLNTIAVGVNDEPLAAVRVSDCGQTDAQVCKQILQCKQLLQCKQALRHCIYGQTWSPLEGMMLALLPWRTSRDAAACRAFIWPCHPSCSTLGQHEACLWNCSSLYDETWMKACG